MFGIGPTELLVVLIVALLVLGPKRLPDMAKSLGRGLAEFRSATSEMSVELDNARILLEEEARETAKATATKKRGARSGKPAPKGDLGAGDLGAGGKAGTDPAAEPEPEEPVAKSATSDDE
jgi:TatA/E family protein of Tat protein translocase